MANANAGKSETVKKNTRQRGVEAWKVSNEVDAKDFPEFVRQVLFTGGMVRRVNGVIHISITTHEGYRTALDGDYIVYESARDRLYIMSSVEFDNAYE